MTVSYHILGQVNTSSNTTATLYTVPTGWQAVVSSISVCNQSTSTATFTIAVQPGGTTLTAKNYINYGTSVLPNDTVILSMGMTMSATDVLSVFSNTSTISFSAFGSEIQ